MSMLGPLVFLWVRLQRQWATFSLSGRIALSFIICAAKYRPISHLKSSRRRQAAFEPRCSATFVHLACTTPQNYIYKSLGTLLIHIRN